MASIFDILLNRGKIEAQVKRKLGGKKDTELLAHQNDFKEFLYLLNQFIKEEIHLMDLISRNC